MKKSKKGKINIDALLGKVFNQGSDQEIDEAQARSWKRLEARMAKDERDLSLHSIYGDGWSVGPVTQREFQVLSAISLVGGPREPGDILRTAKGWAPGLFLGQVFTTLMDLEKKGFVAGHPGRSEGLRLYEVTAEGERALGRAREEGKELASDAEEGPVKDGHAER